MTAEQAISRSISHNEIVTLDWEHVAQTDLIVACDDWVDGNEVREFWGERGGHSWRVHMRLTEQRNRD